MKKFYISAIMAAIAIPSVYAVRPGEVTDLAMTFDFNNGDPIISGSFNAPTMDGSYSNPQPLTEIAKIEVTRGCYEVGEMDVPVFTIENPAPGQAVSFTDTEEVSYGYSYTYSVKVYSPEMEASYATTKQLYVGVKPKKPVVTYTTGENGSSPVTFSITAPSQTADGAELPVPLTKIELRQYINYASEPVLHTIENPVAGQTYTWVHQAENGQSYTYQTYAFTDYGTSDYTSVSVFVGADVPAAPQNLALTFNEQGHAVLTWTAPTAGQSNGYIDPADTRYTVLRVVGSENITLADDLAECQYIDDMSDLTSPVEMYYRVYSKNSNGQGSSSYTDNITAGPAAHLPFIENFNEGYWSKEPENLWTTDPDGYYSNWDYYDSDYEYGLTGVDATDGEDEGYAYCSYKYANEGDEDSLISSHIDLTAAQYPVVTFYTATANGNPVTLNVEMRKDAESTTLLSFVPGNNQEAGANPVWQKSIVPADALKGNKVNLVFHVIGTGSDIDYEYANIYLDKVVLDDYRPVATITPEYSEGSAALSWEAPATAGGTVADKYEVVVNDGEPVVVTEPAYTLATVTGTEYRVAVRAIYGDVPSCLSEPLEFTAGDGVGITGVTVSGSEKAEYFDLNGLKVVNPANGATLIRRTIMADGSIRYDKVVVRNR